MASSPRPSSHGRRAALPLSSSPRPRIQGASSQQGSGTPSNTISLVDLPSSSDDSSNSESESDGDSFDENDVDQDEQTRAALATSGKMIRGTRSDSTIKQYERTLVFIRKTCAQSIPDALNENGDFKAPMSKQHLKIFLGLMGAERSDGTVKAKASVESYVNALKYYFKDVVKKPFKTKTSTFIKGYMNGYKRVVSKKKAQGIMKAKEGKIPVTVQVSITLPK